MAQAYTPGLKVTNRIRHQVRRVLPIPGTVLVGVGDTVDAQQIVAETFMPGDITPLNMANLLSMPPGDVPECMIVEEGDGVKVGDLLAETKGIFGFLKNGYRSKVEGTIETISPVTGQVIVRGAPIPVQVKAYMKGTVVEVIAGEGVAIENEVSFIQGIFGVGGETYGRITMAAEDHAQPLTPEMITPEMKDMVVVGGARVTDEAIKKAQQVGAAAVVSGGLDDQDLKKFLGYDLGVAITGSEDVGLTVVVTEGFGDIAMAERTFQLLKSRAGDEASVNGATQIRAGVMRPEILVPLTADELAHEAEPEHTTGLLEIGRPVRIIRDPYFGRIGQVSSLPPEPAVLGSGSKARVLEVKFDSGESVVVPRANVELIEA
ncbi:MAG: hypothetical protein ACYTJ0_04610 [Planctomycetota bacterium]|jgi:hypothetical protein